VLDVTQQTRFVPGSNLKGNVSGASWALLLDRPELGRTLFLGAPSVATLAMVAPLAVEVMIWEPRAEKRRQVQAWIELSGLGHVSVASRPQAVWQLHDLRADLVCRTREERPEWRPTAFRHLLRPGGRFYLERLASPWQLNSRKLDPTLGGGPGWPLWLWLTPQHGEIRSAVPAGDHATERWFLRNALSVPGLGLPGLAGAARALARRGVGVHLKRRFGILGGGLNGNGATLPPRYLRELAHENGLDFDRRRWGLWGRGEYRSQKLVFFLFHADGEAPEYVVKMVRSPAFSGRLENEYRALAAIQGLGPEQREHVPGVRFLGHPGRLAAVCETMEAGEPFRKRTRGGADCVYARQAVQWLTDLGAATVRAASGTTVVATLHWLFERFQEIYRPAPEERAFLEAQIARLGASPHLVPTVLQHGDPGIWNLLVRADGRVVFMDWEGAESRGMPLWDLFYFLRSYALARRVRGLHGRLEAFTGHFLGDSSLSGFIRRATADYCARVGIHPSLVEPLFYTCWMHRALKESNRLPPERLGASRFLELLRYCIARRQSPGLQRLFACGEAGVPVHGAGALAGA
jgi:hypothetical protein